MRVVSRNCTEDGWSEPFPHYFDACGFDDYESEPGDQVSLPPPRGVEVGLRRRWKGKATRGLDVCWDYRRLGSPGSIHEHLLCTHVWR